MVNVVMTALVYLLTMVMSYILKRAGLFHKEDKKVLSNLIFYITLPASLISSFAGAEVNVYYVIAILLGFLVNTVMVISGQIVSADKSPELKAIYSVNASGFNMACIAIPFLSTFYPAGVPYLCMFDVGDSFYTLGTTYAIGKMRLNGGSKDKNENYVLTILKGLLTSVPFDTYMIMTILSFLNCRLPDFITMAADFCGKGNGFLTMIMIGVSLELHMSRESAKEVITLLSMRYVIGIIAAVLIYCVLPAPLVMRQILAAAMFASSAAVSIIYSDLAKCLLYALNGGVDEVSKKQVGPKYRAVEGDTLDYDDVVAKYNDMMKWLAGVYVNSLNIIHYMHDKYCYERIQMALHDKHVHRWFATGIAGLSVVADSLSAIKYAKVHPVRDENGIIVDFETEGEFPKYGNDDDRVDQIAHDVVHQFMEYIRMNDTYRNSVPTTSVLTITSNVVYGKKTGSTPDGRKAGQPFAPGANPMHKRDSHGAIASLSSVSKLPFRDAQDGISNTFSIIPSALGKEDQVFFGDIDLDQLGE